MRILATSAYFSTHPGGIEIVADRLVRELAAQGHDVEWLAADLGAPPDLADGARALGVPVWNAVERVTGIPAPVPFGGAFRAIAQACRRADVVLMHDVLYLSNMVVFLAAKLRRKPVIIIQHVGLVPYSRRLPRLLMLLANSLVGRPMLAKADQVVFISETTAAHYRSVRFAAPPQTIFNGVDTAIFHPGAGAVDRVVRRKALGLSGERPLALFVGRFVEKKGIGVLRRAASRRPGVDWAFAGAGPLDPTAWSAGNVRVFHSLDQIRLAELYRAADVLVLPSVGEGFPLVIQEALASGLPVICGRDSAEADPQARPFLEPVDVEGVDPEAAAEGVCAALDRVLEASQAGRWNSARMSEFVTRRYSWSSAARRYAAIAEALAARRR